MAIKTYDETTSAFVDAVSSGATIDLLSSSLPSYSNFSSWVSLGYKIFWLVGISGNTAYSYVIPGNVSTGQMFVCGTPYRDCYAHINVNDPTSTVSGFDGGTKFTSFTTVTVYGAK